MPSNEDVIDRLEHVNQQLVSGYRAGRRQSSATKGNERECFIKNFLQLVYPNHYRFGDGDIIDAHGYKTGQIDVVIEYPFCPSLPVLGGDSCRLYLAEGVAAALEIKSDISNQWQQAVQTAKKVKALQRSYDTSIYSGAFSVTVPVFVVGFEGWTSLTPVMDRLSATPEIDGILIINHGIFASNEKYGRWAMDDPAKALWGFISCLHRAISSMKFGSVDTLKYIDDFYQWKPDKEDLPCES